MSDPLQTNLAALAGEVEKLARRIEAQQAEISQAQESADHAHRVLMDIVDRVKAIADQHTTGSGNGKQEDSGDTSWLTIDDPAAATVALGELVDWLGRVYVHYPGAVESLGECWPWHPAAVEELMALHSSWLAAYTGSDSSGVRAMDWHDRHLPGVQRRLRAALGDCSIAAHRRGGRADQLARPVPAAAAVDDLAEWWATSHGGTGAPAPTPDTEATIHR